jgi:hypothetical protein
MNAPRAVAFAFLVAAGGLFGAESSTVVPWVRSDYQPGDFPLVQAGKVADLVVAAGDFKVVHLAAADLASDVEQVTGRRLAVRTDAAGLRGPVVLIGTLGQSPVIDALVGNGKLGGGALRGQWESFLIATVADPLPGVSAALVIAGSDRRGTAFGVYELCQAIGVSPWRWWADVVPAHRDALIVAAGTRRFGPPSVQYRGIFLNDEDWGLQPWAAKTYEPEVGDIGPKTYARICELLLRLKANTLWPAMHACTKPFNHYAANKIVADDHAIVMGSSHAEPMLRDNVGEWTAPPETFNYLANRTGVLKYWEDRVAENGEFENIYTLGMRGIHDSNMQGPKTDPERIRTLEQIFSDQRALLAKYVNPQAEHVPQMFCAYKEVLGLYRQGLKVPEDVTIVWPDDNFGYVRNYATAEELKRPGGFGIYYHLSYLGAPMSYLWLYTTPPALVWEEMSKAYDHGARRLWIANVGDLKPGEIGTEFFLQMAWDIKRWGRDNVPDFLAEWAAREFGAEHAREIARIMGRYYALNYQRKPEHLQWWLPNQPPRASPLTETEIMQRLAAFAALEAQARAVSAELPANKQDSFYELVLYPVRGSTLANRRYFEGERSARGFADGSADSAKFATAAQAADAHLREETRRFNEEIAGGKWRGMVNLEPADNQWRSMRIAPWALPKFQDVAALPPASPTGGVISLEAEHFEASVDRGGAGWRIIRGLGRSGDSVAMFPTTTPSIEPAEIAATAPRLDYAVEFGNSGEFPVTINLIPTQPIRAGRGLRFALGLDDQPPQEVIVNVRDGSAEWAQGVLNATVVGTASLSVKSPGAHTLHVYGVDPGVVLDKIMLDTGGLQPSYLGPPETR